VCVHIWSKAAATAAANTTLQCIKAEDICAVHRVYSNICTNRFSEAAAAASLITAAIMNLSRRLYQQLSTALR
jgi:hypothetical protein